MTGNGRTSYLAPETTELLGRWLTEAGLRQGPLFRSLHLSWVGARYDFYSPAARLFVSQIILETLENLNLRVAKTSAGLRNELDAMRMRLIFE